MRKLLSTVLLSSVAASAFAGDVEVKLGGMFDVRAAVKQQNHTLASKKYVSESGAKKRYALDTLANVRVDVSSKADNGMMYGARLNLNTTAQGASYSSMNGSYAFMEHDAWGRVEMGSPFGASVKMFIDAYNIDAGTQGDWDMYADTSGGYIADATDAINATKPTNIARPTEGETLNRKIHFLTNNNSLLEGMRSGNGKESTRKISYYTPKFNGLQAGASYTPDTTNKGDDKSSVAISNSRQEMGYTGVAAGQSINMKDVITAGVSYEHDFGGTSMKASATYEHGKLSNPGTGDDKLKNLKAYSVGAMLKHGNYALAAGYKNHGKSFTSNTLDDGKSRTSSFYDLGVAYSYGNVDASLVYFNSKHRGNKLNAWTLATSYKLAPGLMPYAEVTRFDNKGYYSRDKVGGTESASKKRTGTVFILGTKLAF